MTEIDVEVERARFEERLQELRERVASEWGWAPRAAPWLLALAGGAVGLALAFRRRRRRRSSRPGRSSGA
ncbi:MAG TPA: hypothetical protein VLA75_03195 [Thermoanaerobaculia bacterium]|nr:hypothetical protein [Thermoanaerobaculia bacterium]